VFDLLSKSEKIQDLKPLYDKSLNKNAVNCLDMSQSMTYLVAGYASGAIALFDMRQYKLVKLIKEAHSSEVLSVKIYQVQEDKKDKIAIGLLSCEVDGVVLKSEITKGFLNFDVKEEELFLERFKNPRSISVYKPDDRFMHSYWAKIGLFAIAASSEVIVFSINPLREHIKLSRPKMCKATSVPYLSFGYGLSPTYRHQTMQMLAVAWDTII
jgi:WD40 repeat protein